jgi:sugar (pentulose or hexulose) kinase
VKGLLFGAPPLLAQPELIYFKYEAKDMNFIGVDIGGTVTKAGIYNELGQEIHVASQYAQVLSEQPGFTERNMHELWDTVCSVIKKRCMKARYRR